MPVLVTSSIIVQLCIMLTFLFANDRLTKRSWFGMLMGSEREEHHFVMVREKSISQIKSDLIHAFLCVSQFYCHLSHAVIYKNITLCCMGYVLMHLHLQHLFNKLSKITSA